MSISLIASEHESLVGRAVTAALSGLSPATCRVYKSRIDSYIRWSEGRTWTFDRESVKSYLRYLESTGSSPQVRNQTLAALKKLASESSESGWIDHQTASQIERIKSRKISGIRTGRWLTLDQVKELLALLRGNRTIQGRRDLVTVALLIGTGLRRSEVCGLTVDQIVRRGSPAQSLIVNLTGKGNRIRSVALPEWTARILDEWTSTITG